MSLWKTFEKLNKLYESKQDIDNFINKFGQENYDLFRKSTQRLKNNNISTDLVWHTKNTEKKDLESILYNLQNRIITKDGKANSEIAGEYNFLGEENGYKVYKILDHIAAINLGVGTGWCISGRYNHYDDLNYKPTEAEAKKHWDDYAKINAQIFFFVGSKSIRDKFAIVLYKKLIPCPWGHKTGMKTNYELFNSKDKHTLFEANPELPVNLIPAKLEVIDANTSDEEKIKRFKELFTNIENEIRLDLPKFLQQTDPDWLKDLVTDRAEIVKCQIEEEENDIGEILGSIRLVVEIPYIDQSEAEFKEEGSGVFLNYLLKEKNDTGLDWRVLDYIIEVDKQKPDRIVNKVKLVRG